MKQKTLFKISNYTSEFGGSLNKLKRKTRRPLSNTNPLNVVLKADTKQTGSLLQFRPVIDRYFNQFANRFKVKIYEKGIAGNHIHFVALFPSRLEYRKFIKALTGSLARTIKIKWNLRPWTRILKWGQNLDTAIKYTIQNHREATGEIPYVLRKKRKVDRGKSPVKAFIDSF